MGKLRLREVVTSPDHFVGKMENIDSCPGFFPSEFFPVSQCISDFHFPTSNSYISSTVPSGAEGKEKTSAPGAGNTGCISCKKI